VSKPIRQVIEFGVNTAVTSVSLLAVLILWPLLNFIRAIAGMH